MFQVRALASGSSGNAFLVRTDRVTFLVEAGLPAPKLLKALAAERVDAHKLAAAFVSHEHRDHVQAAETLAVSYRVPIMANEHVLKASGLRERPEAYVVEVGKPTIVGDVEVQTFPVPHDSVSPVGFRLRNGGKTICIATDLGDDCPELGGHIGDADLVILEANHDPAMVLNGLYPRHLQRRIMSSTGHLSNGQAAAILMRYVRRNGVDVWLAHLSQNNNTPKLAQSTVSRLLRGAGLDRLRVDVVARSKPSLIWPPPPKPTQLSLFGEE